MTSIQDMVDVNTIIGDPIETNNIVIIPISKVCFGFAAGGSEFSEETIDEYNKKEREEKVQYKLPFGGGSGAGVCINPIAFLVVLDKNVKLLPVIHSSALDNLLDYYNSVKDLANSPKSLLDGKEIMEILNLRPSKIVGEILDELKELQLSGEIASKDEAILYIKNKAVKKL